MNIEVVSTVSQINQMNTNDKLVVVIDVLRASSVICTALFNGAKAFNLVAKKQQIPLKKELSRAALGYENDWAMLLHIDKDNVAKPTKVNDYLYGGECNGFKLNDNDLGNSPLEYSEQVVKNKTIFYSTTNGTKAIKKITRHKELIIASFLNIDKVCAYIANQQNNVTIVCAGTHNMFSLDDALCAGNIIEQLRSLDNTITLSETAYAHKLMYQSAASKGLHSVLDEACVHYHFLKNNGFKADLDYCLQKNICPVIPKLINGRVKLACI